MNPLLLPLVLIIYAEASYCEVTRKISRVLLYTFVITSITTTYIEDLQLAYFSLLIIHTCCFIVCINLCQTLVGKCVFFILLLGVWLIILVLLLPESLNTLGNFGEVFFSNSNYFYRELCLVAIGSCSFISTNKKRITERENSLLLFTVVLWLIEKQF
jgi:hypothetical protein